MCIPYHMAVPCHLDASLSAMASSIHDDDLCGSTGPLRAHALAAPEARPALPQDAVLVQLIHLAPGTHAPCSQPAPASHLATPDNPIAALHLPSHPPPHIARTQPICYSTGRRWESRGHVLHSRLRFPEPVGGLLGWAVMPQAGMAPIALAKPRQPP